MDTKYDFSEADLQNLVYVRPVPFSELPKDVQEQAKGAQPLYAVHNSEGERLALVNNRELAFVLARQNDLAPVNVH